MRLQKTSIAALAALSLSGCAQLGIKSTPWPSSVKIYNKEEIDFLRRTPELDGTLGANLFAKDMASDSRLLGLSVSGGGARATAFTLGVLAELQVLKKGAAQHNLLDEVDFISSNSGGSWGVAAYLADRSQFTGPAYILENRIDHLRDHFVEISGKERVTCWSTAMQTGLFENLKFKDIYKSGSQESLPAIFFNASMLPASSPFVFTENFIAHYGVKQFGSCKDTKIETSGKLADIPFSYAAATSGTVPGFYYAYAKTSLCEPGGAAESASMCFGAKKGKARDHLRLADGGLYDNLGYKTAFEIMVKQSAKSSYASKAIIMINSDPFTNEQTVKRSKVKSGFLTTIAANGLFAVQDSSFERLRQPMFKAIGVDKIVLIDFFGAAGFTESDEKHLNGLDELAFYAAHNVLCYGSKGRIKSEQRDMPEKPKMPTVKESLNHLREKGGDCFRDNFYRAGTLSKTTYKFDRELFTILSQLGRLSVRMNADKLSQIPT